MIDWIVFCFANDAISEITLLQSSVDLLSVKLSILMSCGVIL